MLKAFFGYTQTLYLAQAIGYLAFLSIVGSLYFKSITGWKFSANPSGTVEPGAKS